MAAELMYIAAIQSIDPRSSGNTVSFYHTKVLHWMQHFITKSEVLFRPEVLCDFG